ncbi:hypothetical protein YC2023_048882 [Brassica napus]
MWPIHKNMEAPIGDVANPQEYGGVKGVIGSSRTGKMSRLSLGFDVCGNE